MRQAIVTKYIGPTDTKPGRIKATASAGSKTTAWEHGLNADANHTAAARALALKLGWSGVWYGGGMPDGNGNVYVDAAQGFSEDSFSVHASE